MKSKEKFIWDIATEILESHGDTVDNISIHEHDNCGDEHRKIYCSYGYCFELTKVEADKEEFQDVEDGFIYSYSEPWDGFKKAGIDKAVEILNVYAGLKL